MTKEIRMTNVEYRQARPEFDRNEITAHSGFGIRHSFVIGYFVIRHSFVIGYFVIRHLRRASCTHCPVPRAGATRHWSRLRNRARDSVDSWRRQSSACDSLQCCKAVRPSCRETHRETIFPPTSARFWPNPAAHLGLYSMAAVHPKQTFAIRVLFIIYEQ